MERDLVDSIAALAPRLRPNDTVFVSRDLWWTVVSEEMSAERHVVSSSISPAADGLVWYGAGLSIWSVFSNGLLLIVLLSALLRGRVPVSDVLHRCFLVNHVVVQVLTSSLVVPLTVAVEKLEGGWPFGGTACRVWIVARLWLSGANFWSLLAVVFDRFLSVAASTAYSRLVVGQRAGGRATTVLGVVLASWLTAALALVPTAAAINRPNFVLEQVSKCACSMASGINFYSQFF